jgi:hypothetical protein
MYDLGANVLKIMKYAYRGLNVGSSCPSDKKTFDGVEE